MRNHVLPSMDCMCLKHNVPKPSNNVTKSFDAIKLTHAMFLQPMMFLQLHLIMQHIFDSIVEILGSDNDSNLETSLACQ